jgi:hypothetical protein
MRFITIAFVLFITTLSASAQGFGPGRGNGQQVTGRLYGKII